MGLPDTVEVFMAQYAITRAVVDPVVDASLAAIRGRVSAVVDRAREKAGDRELEPGERTAWAVLDTAWKNDDAIVADYLGGILAASTRHDLGVPVAALIARLSSLDLRLHFALYSTSKRLISADGLDVTADPDLYISDADLLDACALPRGSDGVVQLQQSLRNLGRERLIGQVLHNGFDGSPPEPFVNNEAETRRWFKRVPPEPGIVFAPCADGMALLAWGAGLTDPSPETFRASDLSTLAGGIDLPECVSAKPVSQLPGIESPA